MAVRYGQDDSEDIDKEQHMMLMNGLEDSSDNRRLRRLGLASRPLTLIFSTISIFFTILTLHSSPSVRTIFASVRTNQRQTLDAVIAYYDEDVAAVVDLGNYFRLIGKEKGLQTRVYLYTKNSGHEGTDATEILRLNTRVDEVIYLPNIGREGETYLRHVIKRYQEGDTADWTLFTQARMDGFESVQKQDAWLSNVMTNYFSINTSYVSLGVPQRHYISLCGNSTSGQFWPRLREISNLIYGNPFCTEGQMVSWNGQFIVSRQAILAKPLKLYQALYAPFLEPSNSTFHQSHGAPWCAKMAEENGGVEDIRNPCWGHYVERSWSMLFGCAQADLAERCNAGQFCGCWQE